MYCLKQFFGRGRNSVILPQRMNNVRLRVSSNGKAPASQADYAGSIPVTRSILK